MELKLNNNYDYKYFSGKTHDETQNTSNQGSGLFYYILVWGKPIGAAGKGSEQEWGKNNLSQHGQPNITKIILYMDLGLPGPQ